MKKIRTLATLAVTAALTACTENLNEVTTAGSRLTFTPTIVTADDWDATRAQQTTDVVRLTADNEQPLYLHTTVEPRTADNGLTRGVMVEGSVFPATSSFGVSGYRYSAASPLSSTPPNFFYNAEVTCTEGLWTSSKDYYIPTGAERLAFYAYYPYDATAASLSGSNDAGPLTIDYTVSTTQQQDLMAVAVENLTYQSSQAYSVPLQFQHQLTAIRFELSEDVAPGYVKKVGFRDVGLSGTDAIGTGWTITHRDNLTIDFTNNGASNGFDTNTLSSVTSIVAGDQTLLMIPQVFADDDDDPCISLVINDGTRDHTLFYHLKGTRWLAGTLVTYRLSTSSINVLRVSNVAYPTTWGGEPFTIKSDYNTDEALGIFVVDETGTVVNANARYYKTASGWTTDLTEGLPYNSAYKYFAYYPYRATLAGAPAAGDKFIGTSADDFFAAAVSQWTVNTDQGTADKLIANDLQIGKGTAGSRRMTMDFQMEHQMGLATLLLEAHEVPTTRFFHHSSSAYYDTTEKTALLPSNAFTGTNIPCPTSDDTQYYYVAQGGTAPVFSSSSTGDDRWSNDVQINVTANKARFNGTAQLHADSRYATVAYYYKGWYWPDKGSFSDFTAEASKTYKLEVWGASGGDISASYIGGRGGYSYGTYSTTASKTLYIVVGGAGGGSMTLDQQLNGGYNGGGNGWNYGSYWSAGGGATHVATVSGLLATLYSQRTTAVLIVAGGGGGAGYSSGYGYRAGGYGGGTSGGQGGGDRSTQYAYGGYGGTQSAGGSGWQAITNSNGNPWVASNGGFGYGGGYNQRYWGSGGGAGWYGGGGGYRFASGAGGGSGYVGGVSTPKQTINGATAFPAAKEGDTEIGHSGDGYARITLQEF